MVSARLSNGKASYENPWAAWVATGPVRYPHDGQRLQAAYLDKDLLSCYAHWQMRAARRPLLRHGLLSNVDTIFGIPGESQEDRRLIIRLVEDLARMDAAVRTHAFVPLAGTPALDEGHLAKRVQELAEQLTQAQGARLAALESEYAARVVAALWLDEDAACPLPYFPNVGPGWDDTPRDRSPDAWPPPRTGLGVPWWWMTAQPRSRR